LYATATNDYDNEDSQVEAAEAQDLDDFDTRGGRSTGTPNYQNAVFIRIVESILPYGNEEWKRVAILYQAESRETFLRDEAKLIINWKKVSNGGRKPTGAAGGKSDRILRCINIQRRINAKSGAVIMGASSADNNESNDDSSLEPSIIETAVDGGTDQEPPPFVIATPSIITGTNMPTAATSVAASAARRSSQTRTPTPTSFNAAKTKNSSNKERGSVLKSIDKLTASMDGGGGGGGGDQSMMSMLAMQMQQNAQSQFMQQQMFQQQFQMQMGQMTKEIKKGNNLTGKLVNAIAKKMSGKKRRKKVDSGDSSSSDGEDSHSSGDD
jgi:hypothetical protein